MARRPIRADGPLSTRAGIRGVPRIVIKSTPRPDECDRARQEFEACQRLTAEGKPGEPGKNLEEHRRTLEELKKATAGSR